MTTTETTLDAENSLAGAILVDPSCMRLIPGNLRDTDFLSENCRIIYQAARDLEKKGKIIDPVTVGEWAKRRGKILSPQYLLELMEITPTCASAGAHAKIVHEDALRRAAQEVGTRLAANNTDSVQELIGDALQTLTNISTHVGTRAICFADVPLEEPKWLMKPYIQIGKGTMVQAEPGTGKTAFVCAVAAAVSTGREILGVPVEGPGDVLMLSTEDDIGVLRGRIEANGGDLTRIHTMNYDGNLTLTSPEIEQEVKNVHAKLLVFDPFQAFLGAKVDLHRANETRPVLSQLFEMCRRNECACIVIAHLGKVQMGKTPVTMSLGSVDIPGAMRSILHIGRNSNLPGELVAIHVKSNNAAKGKSICYSIGEHGRVDFHELNDLEVSDLARSAEKEDSGYDREPMVRVLNELLTQYPQGGFWSYEDLKGCCVKLFGFCPFANSRQMGSRLSALRKELLSRDGIQLETNQRVSERRGVRVHRYEHPDAIQRKLDL